MLFEVKYPFIGVQWKSGDASQERTCTRNFWVLCGLDVDVCGSCGVIVESSPLRGKVRLTVNSRFREPARRSYRTIDMMSTFLAPGDEHALFMLTFFLTAL